MSRLALLAGLLLLAGVGGLLAVGVLRDGAPTRQEQVQHIAAELRCPDCQALSVAESHTAAADAIRAEIAIQLEAGRSPIEIRQHFVDRYGEWILLAPASPLAWLLPLLVIPVAGAALAWWLMRGRGPTPPQATGPGAISDGERQRLRDELEQLDA